MSLYPLFWNIFQRSFCKQICLHTQHTHTSMAFSCGHFLELINLSLSDFFFDWCTVGFFFLLLLKSLSSFLYFNNIFFFFNLIFFCFFFHTTLLKHICKYVCRLLSCIWFFFLDLCIILKIELRNRIKWHRYYTELWEHCWEMS